MIWLRFTTSDDNNILKRIRNLSYVMIELYEIEIIKCFHLSDIRKMRDSNQGPLVL